MISKLPATLLHTVTPALLFLQGMELRAHMLKTDARDLWSETEHLRKCVKLWVFWYSFSCNIEGEKIVAMRNAALEQYSATIEEEYNSLLQSNMSIKPVNSRIFDFVARKSVRFVDVQER